MILDQQSNPYAFPLADTGDGMTLLDYFAAKAMQSCFAGEGARMVADRDQNYDETNWAQVVASNSYDMAAAMLEERKKYSANNSQIKVSVEGEKPITLAEFIAINQAEGEDNLLTDEDIASVSNLAIGDHIHVGLSEVKRVS